jgi:protein O-GlcNAc transferase
LRERLLQNRLNHPLFDTARLTRHIEAAYATMIGTWQRGRAAEEFQCRGDRSMEQTRTG